MYELYRKKVVIVCENFRKNGAALPRAPAAPQVVYIDADCVALAPLDELFDRPTPVALAALDGLFVSVRPFDAGRIRVV